jgi:hypothetical protein
MEYKGLQYDVYPEYDAVFIEYKRNWDDGGIKAIIAATKFTELLGHLKPENVIVDERRSSRLPEYFIDFLQTRLFKDATDYGVKRIFYIVRGEELNYAIQTFRNKPSFVYFCPTLEEVFSSIEMATQY